MVRNEFGRSLYVFEARKRVLGEEHAYTLWSAKDLSKILCDRSRATTAAVKLREDLVPVVERTLGEKHVGMNTTKANLARAYIKCDRWADPEPLIHESYAQTAEDHPDWIDVATGLVRVQHSR